MLTKDTQLIELPHGMFVIKSENNMTVFAIKIQEDGKEERMSIIGSGLEVRYINKDYSHFEINTNGFFSVTINSYAPRQEHPDLTPLAVPIKEELTLKEEIQMYIREALGKQEINNQKPGTFEEENDFEIEDELPDPTTPYEVEDMVDDEQMEIQYDADKPSDTHANPEPSPEARKETIVSDEATQTGPGSQPQYTRADDGSFHPVQPPGKPDSKAANQA